MLRRLGFFLHSLSFFSVWTKCSITCFSKSSGLRWGGRKKRVSLSSFWFHSFQHMLLPLNLSYFYKFYFLLLLVRFISVLSFIHVMLYNPSETRNFLRTETMSYFPHIISFILSSTCAALQELHTGSFMRGTVPALNCSQTLPQCLSTQVWSVHNWLTGKSLRP